MTHYGVRVPNWPVTVEIGPNATVTPAGPWVTDAQGQLTLAVTATVAGPYTLRVTPEHGRSGIEKYYLLRIDFDLVVIDQSPTVIVGTPGYLHVQLTNGGLPAPGQRLSISPIGGMLVTPKCHNNR